jgi:hypothetical protein
MTIHVDILTLPVLDARLASLESNLNASIQELRHELKTDIRCLETRLEARLEHTKAELFRWVFLVMLANVALGVGITALLAGHIG